MTMDLDIIICFLLLITGICNTSTTTNKEKVKVEVISKSLTVGLHKQKIITPHHLNLTEGKFILSKEPQYGVLQVYRPVNNLWYKILKDITQFTEKDLKIHKIRYFNRKEATEDRFEFRSLNVNPIQLREFRILILESNPTLEKPKKVYVVRGKQIVIDRKYLKAISQLMPDTNVTFSIVTKPQHGTLLVNGSKITTGFTQEDVNNGYLVYRSGSGQGYDLSATLDNFQFRLGINYNAIEKENRPTIIRIFIQNNDYKTLHRSNATRTKKNRNKDVRKFKRKNRNRVRRRRQRERNLKNKRKRRHRNKDTLKPTASDSPARKYKIKCRRRWSHAPGIGCYLVLKANLTWQRARKNCRRRGGDLVIPRTYKQTIFLTTKVSNQNMWIGYRELRKRKKWVYVNGKDKNHITPNWNNNDTNIEKKHSRRRRCAMASGVLFDWYPKRCNAFKARAICHSRRLRSKRRTRRRYRRRNY